MVRCGMQKYKYSGVQQLRTSLQIKSHIPEDIPFYTPVHLQHLVSSYPEISLV